MSDGGIWLFILTVSCVLSWRCGMWWESKRPEREQRAKEKQRLIIRKAKLELAAERASERGGE